MQVAIRWQVISQFPISHLFLLYGIGSSGGAGLRGPQGGGKSGKPASMLTLGCFRPRRRHKGIRRIFRHLAIWLCREPGRLPAS
jgi:hypothetical protein